jgi:hypothetical protein
VHQVFAFVDVAQLGFLHVIEPHARRRVCEVLVKAARAGHINRIINRIINSVFINRIINVAGPLLQLPCDLSYS